jgi:hypothetical protein
VLEAGQLCVVSNNRKVLLQVVVESDRALSFSVLQEAICRHLKTLKNSSDISSSSDNLKIEMCFHNSLFADTDSASDADLTKSGLICFTLNGKKRYELNSRSRGEF